LSFVSQVHGTAVHHVTDTAAIRAGAEADAQVSALAGVGLVIMVADCTPVLLADTEAGVIGAVHAGRPGMAAGIVSETLSAMRELGAREIHAVIGPSVCPRCYEVPASLRDEVAAVEPVAASVSVSGTPA
ncbi:laccase domain-containing protein, partial [Geobacillus sp. MMMUD3]|nr:laccase domain-containing protein [Geobacillus sp. MMMUD3]